MMIVNNTIIDENIMKPKAVAERPPLSGGPTKQSNDVRWRGLVITRIDANDAVSDVRTRGN